LLNNQSTKPGNGEHKHMPSKGALSAIVGSAGLLLAASAAAQVQNYLSVDGTYVLVGSTKLNQTSMSRGGDMYFCPESTPGPLSISQGRAWYVSSSGRHLIGTVNPRGEILIQVIEPRDSRPFEMDVTGIVDSTGTVRARQRGNSCSYELVWRRQT